MAQCVALSPLLISVAAMKIILSVNAIKPPLTGIERYTWELANRVPGMQGWSRYAFSGGRWVNDVGSLWVQSPVKLAVRPWLLRSPVAVAAYRLLSPLLLRQRLRAFSDHVYHAQISTCHLVRGWQSQSFTIFRFYVARSFIRRSVLLSCSVRFRLHWTAPFF